MLQGNASRQNLLTGVLLLPILLLVAVPAATLVAYGVRQGPAGGLTFSHYAEIVHSPYLLKALGATLLFCTSTAALATLLALPAAWWIAKGLAGSRALRSLCQVNFAFNGVVYGILIATLLGNAGLLAIVEAKLFGSEWTRGMVYTTGGLVVGYLGFQIPRAASLLTQAVERLDPQVTQAARVLGASAWQLFAWVLFPQMKVPLLTVFLAIAMMSMASFGVALLLARTVDIFPVLIYKEFTAYGEIQRACAMGVILAGCCLLLEMLARGLASSDPARMKSEPHHG